MLPCLVLFLLIVLGALPLPVEPGTWWEFRESYTERVGDLEATSEDVTRFEVRGSRERPFLHQSGGVDPGSGPIEAGEDWLRLGPWTGEDPLPLPLEKGRAAPGGEAGLRGWLVEEEEDVTVPAGTFRALRCALRTPGSDSVLWIAPGTGIVREWQGVPGRKRPEIERVLLRWAPAASPSPSPAPRPSPRRPGRPLRRR
jgi:hypothetical protein